MGIFSGLKDAKNGNTSFEKPDYPRNGHYVLLLKEADLFANKEGQAAVSAVTQVLEARPRTLRDALKLDENFRRDSSGRPFINPIPVGRDMKFFWLLERDRKDNLTYRGQYEMNRVKAWLSCLFGGEAAGVTDENITEDVAVSVCLGTSRLAQGGSAEDLAKLLERVKEDFGMKALPDLVNMAGQVFSCDVVYNEYIPKQGSNKGKLVSSTEVIFHAMSEAEQKPYLDAIKK